ncbi:hypothetical protein [Saccharococcus thermophilus]|uniref:Uncharacterized protein n=1 Tax=Saccharococcus thermophilus TaxID=29396 RepID=A0A846MEK9_9BACL|nr:hypothetical protein [Saccharococcus thermophilus]NIK15298.1 hypothetical protein [Saccharococcus thermophilus]
MLFRNKKTGLVWEIVDEDHIKRLHNDDDYEEVKEEKEQSKQTSKKSPAKKG